jgi:hypothetical protein
MFNYKINKATEKWRWIFFFETHFSAETRAAKIYICFICKAHLKMFFFKKFSSEFFFFKIVFMHIRFVLLDALFLTRRILHEPENLELTWKFYTDYPVATKNHRFITLSNNLFTHFRSLPLPHSRGVVGQLSPESFSRLRETLVSSNLRLCLNLSKCVCSFVYIPPPHVTP